MKPLLRSAALFSIVLLSQIGWAADVNPPVPTVSTQVAAAAQDLRAKAPPAMSGVQLVTIDNALSNTGSGSLRDSARASDKAPGEGLPSTPVALATLLLMICILIGRRNS